MGRWGEGGTRRRVPLAPWPVGYLRPRPFVRVRAGTLLRLGDLAEVEAPEPVRGRVRDAPWGRGPAAGRHHVVSLLALLRRARRLAPGIQWQPLGHRDVVVEAEARSGPGRWLLGVLVWCLLFVGAGTTLMNFHADVNMPAAHRMLYYLATGRRSERPLIIEIPYAVGLALGSLLFFAAPRGGGDPGPLQLEVARYEQRLRAYWRAQRGRRSGRSARGH